MRIIAGEARGRRIEAPEGLETRPTLDRVRENLFNMLQNRVRDARVLDLFAGSGALSLEALSRGAAAAVLTDISARAHRVEKKNVETLGFGDRARVIKCDWHRAVSLLREEDARFDLIFLDPPYAMTDLREVMDSLRPLLAEDGLILLEHEAGVEITVASGYELVKERKWGFCAFSFYARSAENASPADPGGTMKGQEKE